MCLLLSIFLIARILLVSLLAHSTSIPFSFPSMVSYDYGNFIKWWGPNLFHLFFSRFSPLAFDYLTSTTRQRCYLTHRRDKGWWVPEHVHTPVGPAHCTSGAPCCSEILRLIGLGPQGPSYHRIPLGGYSRKYWVVRGYVLRDETYVLRSLFALRLISGEGWKQIR